MLSDDCLPVPAAIGAGVARFDSLERDEERRVGGVAFCYRNGPLESEYDVQHTFGGKVIVNRGVFRREALLPARPRWPAELRLPPRPSRPLARWGRSARIPRTLARHAPAWAQRRRSWGCVPAWLG